MIDVYDNLLDDHVAEFVQLQIPELSWKFDYFSRKGKPNRHWHIFCGHNSKEVVDKGYEWVLPIWDAVKIKTKGIGEDLNLNDFIRIYMNAHTHGIEPHMHQDDGDFTMIYYPRCDWQKDWGGGTEIDGTLVEYVGNRLVVFNANYWHKAQPVARHCYELRTCIVIKCNGILPKTFEKNNSLRVWGKSKNV